MSKTADILFFGAHPDDVEIGVGGIVAKHAANGYSVAICHLTDAELSSNGTVERRRQEAEEAAKILGVSLSIRLGFPDRGLTGSKEQLLKITQVIRQLRPRVILAPYWQDRHPDHVACSRMVKEAAFDAGIQKRETPVDEPAHRTQQIYYYFINNIDQADIIVDVSDVYEKKSRALLSYNSQFSSGKGQISTPLNQPTYLAMIRGRDQLWGHQIGALYGEGLVSAGPIKKELLV
ncbi:bacillithiol biosynthesis deacetylase BshB1 [Thermoactinomyces mirandus]|uniref:Bacillithiol biosynthesis deacetylase BshB1 n=1 Tax=Thermoactinomyces mirandus TaxID=2756294 RepID=A0A7W1XSU1_9BACL|nr:bacillithiol biosynthesis deacetylase BshB1 [Thermoactinomyces mirandus]MBA4602574.1 bacillithiol biosynthesis deacetylase BshB1 [Thermoactinomyces mirandus]